MAQRFYAQECTQITVHVWQAINAGGPFQMIGVGNIAKYTSVFVLFKKKEVKCKFSGMIHSLT